MHRDFARKRERKEKVMSKVICSLLAGFMFTALLFRTGFLQAEVVEVSIQKMRFIPAQITINQGDTIRWVNKEKRQYHSVWFEALGEEEGDYFFPEEFVERQFNELGEFSYRCGPHPEMLGTINVNSGTANKTQPKITQKRKNELTYIVKQDCGSCHGMLLKGGLGPAILPEKLTNYQVEDLSAVILHGRPGTPMPPWKGILSPQDAKWISTQLKSGGFVDE